MPHPGTRRRRPPGGKTRDVPAGRTRRSRGSGIREPETGRRTIFVVLSKTAWARDYPARGAAAGEACRRAAARENRLAALSRSGTAA